MMPLRIFNGLGDYGGFKISVGYKLGVKIKFMNWLVNILFFDWVIITCVVGSTGVGGGM